MLPPFPLDDLTLDLLAEAIQTTPDDGTDGFTLPCLLDFLSGYDPTKGTWDGADDVWESYSDKDVIRALIHEIRRLRMTAIMGDHPCLG